MKSSFLKKSLVGTLLATAAVPAFAHSLPGDPAGLHNGFAHPFSGWDHLLAMVAVGLWAAQQRGKAVWAIPAAFLTLMSLGGVMGWAGGILPGVELMIGLSVLVLGGLVACSARLNPGVAMGIVGAFAVFHGFAHGIEMPRTASALVYGTGFMTATTLLHGAGLLTGWWLQRQDRSAWVRATGAGLAVYAVSLLF